MQRLMTWTAVFVLIIAMLLNVVLFLQNRQLRQQLATTPRPQATQPTQAPADQSGTLNDLRQQLDRSEQDRIKAAREATSLRDQFNQLQSAAQERDQLRQQVQSLSQQNQQLQSQVDNLQTMNTINGQVVKLRGLTPRHAVERQFMNHGQLRDYFTEAMASQFSPADEQRQRAVLQALDMGGGEGADLRQAQIDDAVKNILGFYDHTTKQLVVVTDRPRMGVRDRVTYAHEFTHSLQDQYYDLQAMFARAAGNSDYEEAIRALVEGDATLSMGLYARANLSAMDIASYKLEQAQGLDLSGIFTPGGGPLTESAAAFPYNEGASFVYSLYNFGGWPQVARAFAKPPRSTEQVLHPQKYIDGDEPVRIDIADLGARIGGGWKVVTEDTLGELYVRIYLEGALSIDQAVQAGMGWGGDRYQVLSDGQGRLALALRSAWDSPQDAQEFFDAYSAYVIARGGGNPAVLQSDAQHMRWQLADRQFYLSRAGGQVLALHAPDGATLDALIRQFPGF
jgi:flagellar motor protein MotB